MSTPAENIVPASPAAEVGMPSLSPDQSWLTSFQIDDPIVPGGAPLPSEAGTVSTEAEKPAEAVATPAKAAAETPAEAKPAEAEPGLEAKPVEAEPAKAVADPELTPEETALIEALPEAQRPEASSQAKRSRFMNHYLNPDKPAEDIRQHLATSSPSRYSELETAVIAQNLAKPDEFCQNLFTRDKDSYSKLATEIYKGAPEFFAKQVTGRDNVDPKTVQTALDFYDRNKDRISDDNPLAELDKETWDEFEKIFPDQAPIMKATLDAAKSAIEENRTLKAAKPADEAIDPKVAEAEQQAAAQRAEAELWQVGEDTIGDFIQKKAYDPTTGAGIHVTAEERKSAPLVARLKDFKAQVLFSGLEVDGKELVPSFHAGFAKWGDGREAFKEVLTHMGKFVKANEKDNVVDVAKRGFPLSETYYQDRLKNPIFQEIDDIIKLVSEKAAPKMDAIIPGALPSGGKATPGVEAGGNWLIQDALARTK